jgi:hypothetical protein
MMIEKFAEKDPLAVHIFVLRRNYRITYDTKSGKRRDIAPLLSRVCLFLPETLERFVALVVGPLR